MKFSPLFVIFICCILRKDDWTAFNIQLPFNKMVICLFCPNGEETISLNAESTPFSAYNKTQILYLKTKVPAVPCPSTWDGVKEILPTCTSSLFPSERGRKDEWSSRIIHFISLVQDRRKCYLGVCVQLCRFDPHLGCCCFEWEEEVAGRQMQAESLGTKKSRSAGWLGLFYQPKFKKMGVNKIFKIWRILRENQQLPHFLINPMQWKGKCIIIELEPVVNKYWE